MMRRISPKKPGIERNSHEDTSQTTTTKEADERRLRKLKGFLKSVSYNGSEGMQFETLNDLYRDSLLLDRPPCTDLVTLGEFKCNPTPFLVSSCFNRTQVDTSTKGKLKPRKTARKTTPNRTRKTAMPNKNAHLALSEIYGRSEGKVRQVKILSKRQEISKEKAVLGQGRRTTLDAAVETAVQAGKSRTPMKEKDEEQKREEKGTKSEHQSQKQEGKEKMKAQECAKETDETEKMKVMNTEKKKLENVKDSLKIKKEMTDDNKEDKQNKQESNMEQEQKPKDKTTRPSTSGKSGQRSDTEKSASGKSPNKSNKPAVTDKTTSLAEASTNAAKTNNVLDPKTKEQDSEKPPKSDDQSILRTELNSSGSKKKEKHHMKETDSPSPAVASTSTENRTSTRLRARSRENDDLNKGGHQLRLRRERPLTDRHKTSASPNKGKKTDPGHGYSIRKRNLRKINTR